MQAQELDRVCDALKAIKLIRGHYGSAEKGYQLTQEVLAMMVGDGQSALSLNVADAIESAIRNKRVQMPAAA
jgi:hypothetical protein